MSVLYACIIFFVSLNIVVMEYVWLCSVLLLPRLMKNSKLEVKVKNGNEDRTLK